MNSSVTRRTLEISVAKKKKFHRAGKRLLLFVVKYTLLPGQKCQGSLKPYNGLKKYLKSAILGRVHTVYPTIIFLIILAVYTHDFICCTNFDINVATVKRRENIPRYEFSKCSTKLQEGMQCSMYIDILKRFARINSNCLFIQYKPHSIILKIGECNIFPIKKSGPALTKIFA